MAIPITTKNATVSKEEKELNEQLGMFKRAKELKLAKIEFNKKLLEIINSAPARVKKLYEYEDHKDFLEVQKEGNRIDIEERNNNILLEISQIQKNIDAIKLKIKSFK